MSFEPEPFQSRHIGPDKAEAEEMLKIIGASSLEALMDEAIPARIRLPKRLDLPDGQPEHQFLRELRGIAARNQLFKSYIGLGYYGCFTPSVILRNVLENPGWYTPYTPYQAEIAQGRLEGLLNFQTMVGDLTGMQIATASLLDEATAAAEAMMMLHRVQGKRIDTIVGPPQFFVADGCFPQTIEVLRSRAEPLGIELVIGDFRTAELSDRMFGAIVQTPDEAGRLHDLREFIGHAKRAGVARGCRDRPAQPDARDAAGRAGRRYRAGELAAVWRAHGIRWSARGVFRHARQARAAGARADYRRVGGRAWRPRVPHGAADARAAHPPGEGHVEHLHGAGSPREHRRLLCRLPRPQGDHGHRTARARVRAAARAPARRARHPSAEPAFLRHAPSRRGGRRPRSPGRSRRAVEFPLSRRRHDQHRPGRSDQRRTMCRQSWACLRARQGRAPRRSIDQRGGSTSSTRPVSHARRRS